MDPPPSPVRTREWLRAGLVLALALAALFAGALWGTAGDVLSVARGDINDIYYPWRSFAASSLRQGVIPFWNPYTFCGAPFAANPETAVFYPLNWPFVWLSFPTALFVNVILHLWLSGLFTWRYARSLDCRFLPAMLAAWVFVGCGANLPRLFPGHLSNIDSVAWLPLLMWAAEDMLRGDPRRAAARGALASAFMILAGNLQYWFYAQLLVTLYVVLRITLFRATARPSSRRTLLALFMMLVGGVGLGALQMGLTIPMALDSDRAHLSEQFCGAFSLPPSSLVTFLLPNFFGPSPAVEHWGQGFAWEYSAYLGVVPLLLIAYGVARAFGRTDDRPAEAMGPSPPQRAAGRTLAAAAVVFLLLALGRHTFMFVPLYRWVPGFSVFRGWTKFLVEASFCLAALSGLSLEWYLRRTERDGGSRVIRRAALMLVCASTVIVGVMCAHGGSLLRSAVEAIEHGGEFQHRVDLMPSISNQLPAIVADLRLQVWNAIMLVAFASLLFELMRRPRWRSAALCGLLLVSGFDLDLANARFITTFDSANLDPPSQLEPLVREAAPNLRVYVNSNQFSPNLAMVYHLRVANGLESTISATLLEVTNAFNRVDFNAFDLPLRLIRPDRAAAAMAIRYLYSGGRLYFIRKSAPRARVLRGVTFVPTSARIWQMLRDDPSQGPLVEGSGTSPQDANRQQAGNAFIEQEDGDSLTVRTDALQDAWLYLADSWATGWTCTVDERPQGILHANFNFRAVRVPRGQHHVRFVYTPPGFVPGVLVSLLSTLVIGWLYRPAPR